MGAVGWIVIVLLCWTALSFIAAIGLGHFIKASDDAMKVAIRSREMNLPKNGADSFVVLARGRLHGI